VSYAIAGVVGQRSLELLFIAAGAILTVTSAAGAAVKLPAKSTDLVWTGFGLRRFGASGISSLWKFLIMRHAGGTLVVRYSVKRGAP
jgi:hypothetical protein